MAEINIYGPLHSKTADGKLARSEQIFDESEQKFQSEINAKSVRSESVRGVEVVKEAPMINDNILYIEVKLDENGQ